MQTETDDAWVDERRVIDRAAIEAVLTALAALNITGEDEYLQDTVKVADADIALYDAVVAASETLLNLRGAVENSTEELSEAVSDRRSAKWAAQRAASNARRVATAKANRVRRGGLSVADYQAKQYREIHAWNRANPNGDAEEAEA